LRRSLPSRVRNLSAFGLAALSVLLVACSAHSSAAAPSADTAVAASAPAGVTAAGDWPTFDYDSARTGVGPVDTGITTRNLGKLVLRKVDLDGTVDASAIELHAIEVKGRRRDVVVVTTTYGKTIALDAGSGAKLWEFVPAGLGRYEGTGQVTTASPTADPDRRYVYAASPDGFIRKLSLATGRQIWSRRVTFDPVHEKLASALNISGPWVVITTGGYIGDIPPYDGHVVTIDRTNGRVAQVWNTECANVHRLIAATSCSFTNTQGDNAIWARQGAVIEPGTRRILVATGNGPFNGSINWGDSVLELTADASRLLHNWTPPNQAPLDATDTDVGSTAPALLTATGGRRLAVQGGKDGKLHLLDLGRLDGTSGPAGPRLGGELQEISSPGGGQVLTAPAVWSSGGHTYVFVADDSGTAAYLLVGGHHPRLRVAWQNSTPGTSPVVAGGLLYVYDQADALLTIRQPTSGVQLKSLPAQAGHWNSPIVVGGRIILPTGSYLARATTGVLDIYHLPGR
jgi:outer membrane protein assembly factor BamB